MGRFSSLGYWKVSHAPGRFVLFLSGLISYSRHEEVKLARGWEWAPSLWGESRWLEERQVSQPTTAALWNRKKKKKKQRKKILQGFWKGYNKHIRSYFTRFRLSPSHPVFNRTRTLSYKEIYWAAAALSREQTTSTLLPFTQNKQQCRWKRTACVGHLFIFLQKAGTLF